LRSAVETNNLNREIQGKRNFPKIATRLIFMEAFFQFTPELNLFLPRRNRNKTLTHTFEGKVPVKDAIESLGVPHPEVAAILVNGDSVDFQYTMIEGDKVEVFGFVAELPTQTLVPLRPVVPAEKRFILDTHLGQLAVYLRMFGFDTLYRNDYDDEELAAVSAQADRILLTRDIGLLKRGIVTHGYFMRETNPKRQVAEIFGRYNLAEAVSPLKRCIRCNAPLETVAKEAIMDKLEANTRQHFNEFSQCPQCEQIYWKGSHYDRMSEFVSQTLNNRGQHA
jgi:uncharacterized protein